MILFFLFLHDELVFELDPAVVTEAGGRIKSLMSAAAALKVALEVDIGVGGNWDEAH